MDKDLDTWDTSDVIHWFAENVHPDEKTVPAEIESALRNHGIRGADLFGLNREDLKDLGYTRIPDIRNVRTALESLKESNGNSRPQDVSNTERIKSLCPMLLPLLGPDLLIEVDKLSDSDFPESEANYWRQVHLMFIFRLLVARTKVEMGTDVVGLRKNDNTLLLEGRLDLALELLQSAEKRLDFENVSPNGWRPLLERVAPAYKLKNYEKLLMQLLVILRIQPLDGPIASLVPRPGNQQGENEEIILHSIAQQAWVCGLSSLQLKRLANEDRSICQERVLVRTEQDYSDEIKLSVSEEVCKALMGQELGVEERLKLAGTKLLAILDGETESSEKEATPTTSPKTSERVKKDTAVHHLLKSLSIGGSSDDGISTPKTEEANEPETEALTLAKDSESSDSGEIITDADLNEGAYDKEDLLADLATSKPSPVKSGMTPAENHQEPRAYTCELDYLNDQFALVMQQVQSSNQRLAQDIKDAAVLDTQPRWMRNSDYGSIKVSAGELRAKLKLAQRKIELTLELTRREGGFYPRLEGLVDQLQLDSFEKSVLLYLAGSMISPIFKSCIASVSGASSNNLRCTVGDLLVVFCPSVSEQVAARTYFYRTGKLVRKGLVRVVSLYGTQDLTDQELKLDRRVLDCIVGLDKESTEVVKGGHLYDPKVELEQVVLPPALKESILDSVTSFDSFRKYRKRSKFDEAISYGVGLTLMFCGPSGTGKTMTANAIAAKLGKKLLLVNFPSLSENDPHNGMGGGVQSIFREAELSDAIIFFDECESLFAQRSMGGSSQFTQLLTELERFDGIVFLATNRPYDLDEAMYRRISEVFDFKAPNHFERLAIWKLVTAHDAIPCEDSIEWESIALQFEITGGYIKNVVISALLSAVGRDSVSPMITQGDITEGCKKQMRGALQMVDFDERLLPRAGIEDLVSSEDVKKPLMDMVQLEKARGVLFGLWGFSDDMRSRQGTTALFWGPKGCGKSSAAEAVGFELGKALKIIDIPQLLAKRIGRTDASAKVRDVFKEARLMDAVLVLDGYSLNTDDGGGHGAGDDSRLLNLLVREMARFPGVVIMMVDTPGSLDIFASRLDKGLLSGLKFLVEFALPNMKTRQVLWKKMLPSDVPTTGTIDFQDLARSSEKFSQVQIGNAIYRAAAAAALRPEKTRQVRMADLRSSIDDEKHRGESAVDRWVKAQYI